MQKGNTKKKRFVALSDAYHGETLGALSVCDIDEFNMVYKPLLLDTLRVEGPDCYRCKYSCNRDSCNAECFGNMEKCLTENHEEISAVIVEPMVQGAAGMKIYSPIYLRSFELFVINMMYILSRMRLQWDLVELERCLLVIMLKLVQTLCVYQKESLLDICLCQWL